MNRNCPLLVVLCLTVAMAAHAADRHTASFDDQSALTEMQIEGSVSVDMDKDRSGAAGGALRVAPQARLTWPLRDDSGTGQVEMWVFDDGSAPADPKKYGAGPLWGLTQKEGPILTIGPVYAPYLSGDTTYATSDFAPNQEERPWWQVQYLGLKRDPSWHKWTFHFDEKEGLRILYDDKDLNADRPVFNWNKTRLRGFTGLVLLGDTTDAAQTLWVDDVAWQLGPSSQLQPLWPPPPPATLATVPPQGQQTPTPYARWEFGPKNDPNFFPIAVWLQSPANAEKYKAAGINIYVAIWQGPTEEQIAELKRAGMSLICNQNDVAMKHLGDPTIVGWMHGDEPDNAQSLGQGKGYGPPVPAQEIVEDFRRIAAADPSRPVLLNLGQGVAWDGWQGRGVRTNHPEDYAEYVEGCDVVSFDIYPAVHSNDEIRGNLWYVAQGVSRLRNWSADRKIVWNCIECTHIGNANVKPTPHQVRAEVWMSIIHGSRGLIYFVHQFEPTFIEAGLLADKEMLDAVSAVNRQIHALASVINSPTLADAVRVTSSSPNVPVHTMVKRHDGATYVFAVSMYHQETEAAFQLDGLPPSAKVEVIGEDRKVQADRGRFADRFGGYDVHLYRIE